MQVSPKLEFNWIISTEGEETDVSPKLEKKESKEIMCGVYGIWFQYDNSAALWKCIWSMPFVLMPMDYFIIILNMTLLFLLAWEWFASLLTLWTAWPSWVTQLIYTGICYFEGAECFRTISCFWVLGPFCLSHSLNLCSFLAVIAICFSCLETTMDFAQYLWLLDILFLKVG